MANSFFSPTPLKLSQISTSISPLTSTKQFPRILRFNGGPSRTLFTTKAVISEVPNQKLYPKVGALSTGPIPPTQLIQVVETAAKTGAEVCSLSLQPTMAFAFLSGEIRLVTFYEESVLTFELYFSLICNSLFHQVINSLKGFSVQREIVEKVEVGNG